MSTSTLPQIPGYTPEQVAELAASRLKVLARRYGSHRRWFDAVDRYVAGDKTALDGKRRPSKQTKYWMYDDAAAVIRLLGLAVDQPRELAQVGEVVTMAKAALR